MRWMGTRFEFKKLFTLLDLCVSSLRRGHANLLCIVPILTDDPRRESEMKCSRKDVTGEVSGKVLLGKEEFQSMKFSPCPAQSWRHQMSRPESTV